MLESLGFPLQAGKYGDMHFLGNVIFVMVTQGILNYTGCLAIPAVLSGRSLPCLSLTTPTRHRQWRTIYTDQTPTG